MFGLFRDKIETARLKARYQRLVQEQLLELVETESPSPVSEDPGNWMLLGDGKSALTESARTDSRTNARKLVAGNPYARNILRLMEVYVVGPGLKLGHAASSQDAADEALIREADRLWSRFVRENRRFFSYREFARRTWRDGECFLRIFPSSSWPPTVRFLDPETIAATRDEPDSHGIVTELHDVETPVTYLRIDLANGELLEQIPAADVVHTRIGVDSNQKRGVTIFAPILDTLSRFDNWLQTELTARKLQASIVLWRRIQGSPSQAANLADAAATGTALEAGSTVRKEQYRAGTILTTSQGTDLQFLQPNTNFADAVPLGRLLLLSTAAGAGLPEFMLTADASNANFASTMVAEGPAVKLFQSEQEFFAAEFEQIWRMVMQEAVVSGDLPDDFFDSVSPQWSFPKLITRDRPRERVADARLVKSKILSRAEIARRDGVDPRTMQEEIAAETKRFGE
ncbi:MAG: phage portal protein [Planctomycetes bacterium]|nr:phage portal protein [Planctomycetota bacterium]